MGQGYGRPHNIYNEDEGTIEARIVLLFLICLDLDFSVDISMHAYVVYLSLQCFLAQGISEWKSHPCP